MKTKCLLADFIMKYLLDKCYVEITSNKTVVQSVAFKELKGGINYNKPIRCQGISDDECIHCATEIYRDENNID